MHTHEEFREKNDVHFLDIKLTSDSTIIFRKNTHTGQYIHPSSFKTPWSYKISCIRSLVSRAHKICRYKTLLSAEINTILKFMSWNGLSKRLGTKLIKQMTPNPDQTQTNYNNNDNQNQQLPRVYIRLPYIAKRGTDLLRNIRTKMLRLLNTPCNITIYWDTMTTSCFVSCKEKTPKEFQSSVVYKFSCLIV